MKASEVYLKAAELCDLNSNQLSAYGCCDYISLTSGNYEYKVPGFVALFRPTTTYILYWGDDWSSDESERRNCRVLALLFMYQIALSEEQGV